MCVTLRPPYLPREFPQIFVMVVYIHPRANADNASETILQSTQKLQAISPDAPVLILGDFNHCSLQKTIRNFDQYVKFPSRLNKTPDLCYGSIKGAYKAIPLPPLGGADHNCIQLIPSYCTALQRGKTVTKRVKVRTDESKLSLQGCYECTDWEMFKQSCSNIDVLADVVSCYVSFCEDNVIPEKTVKVYPNSKPWVTKALRALLYRKRQAFIAGNLPEVEKLKKEVKHEIARAKRSYQEKLEEQLVNNNLGSAWDSMKTIIGTKKTGNPNLVLDGFTCDRKLAQTLNEFYLRFDSPTFKDAILEQKNYLKDSAPAPFDLHDVVDTFRHSKVKKSPGPDNIGGHLLLCAKQLGPIFYDIFKLSLSQQRVPKIWRPKVLNYFRPIALIGDEMF